MTRISDLIKNYRPFLKGQLNKQIRVRVSNEPVQNKILTKGTVSDLLIDKGDGKYHFEACGIACTVTADEITIIRENLK